MSNIFAPVVSFLAAHILVVMGMVVGSILLTTKIAMVHAFFGRGSTTPVRPRRIRQPVVDRETGSDPVQNARRFAEVADANARRFKRSHHLSWWLATLGGLLATMLVGKVPDTCIQIFALLATLSPLANKFFCWQEAWKSARSTSQLLSEIIMDWDQGTYCPDLNDAERKKEFAAQVRQILGSDRERFRATADKQVLPDKAGGESAKKE